MVYAHGNAGNVVRRCRPTAILFGHDTDTTACVGGGLAGIKFGLPGIRRAGCVSFAGPQSANSRNGLQE
ncbi:MULTISPECIES: ADP-ribosylglycohydrolase family protein [Cupriavidus]|uniref:ADP-ribosylglycohydrolase family protein n=1 Tax=Cupriavidus TaxID=106589 RepID=UPI0035221274